MTITLKAGAFPAAFKAREATRVAYLRDAVRQSAIDGAPVLARALPKDLGGLRRSVDYQLSDTGSEVARLVENTPYAKAIEYGTRPFTPPFDAIRAWAERKAGALGHGGTIKDAKHAFKDAKVIARALRDRARTGRKFSGNADGGGFAAEAHTEAMERIEAADAKITALARAIWGGIRKNGIRPTYATKKTLPRLRQILGRNLRAAVQKMKSGAI